MAAALMAAGALGGTTAIALCENAAEDTNACKVQRSWTKNIRDPMTSYAKAAMLREMKEEEERGRSSHAAEAKEDDEPRVQATSAVEVSAEAQDSDMTAAEIRLEKATRKAKQHAGGLKLFSGNGNMTLALEVARHVGISLGKAQVGRFPDGEVNVAIHENVRGKDVYILQPTGPPVNDNVMELLLMVSTLRRASARRITVVIPYYGYARQDRKMQVSF